MSESWADKDSETLWELYAKSPSDELKDELVVRYIPLVEQVAGRAKIGLPQSVELSELVNSGVIGLISAIDNFEPGRGFKFETYAVQRIRGSIIDSLRDYDWMPRSIRSKTKRLEAALVKLEGELGRMPSDEEVADELEIDLDDYLSMMEEVKIASILSLDQTYPTADGETNTLADLLEDEDSSDVEGRFEWNEAKALAKQLIKGLSQQERLVIALYYYEELTLREIGDVLGISESRVSQVHSKVILALKGKLSQLLARSSGE
ncbi:FliA/WhiG family RNA polymerase sigma factor [bacterium]|nr:FliA/WhiG family RNA polymerase sigma factor [bacterium]